MDSARISMSLTDYNESLSKQGTQKFFDGLRDGQNNVISLVLSYLEGGKVDIPGGMPQPFQTQLSNFVEKLEGYIEPAEGFEFNIGEKVAPTKESQDETGD